MEAIAEVLVGLVGEDRATKLLATSTQIACPNRKKKWLLNLLKYLTSDRKEFMHLVSWKRRPVDPETFLCDPFYLNKRSEVYPPVLREFIEMNNGTYDEAVLTGGIGSAKTTIALYTQAYQLYLLSCMNNPQQMFGLDSSSELKIIFQSLRKSTATTVDFNRFYNLLNNSPYFTTVFPFDTELTSIMRFPNRIEVEPVSGSETASIGQNVIGGIIDEINFMAVVENSKQSVDGGTYNQAVELYNSIARRRKSRFMGVGRILPGMVCVVSSKRIPGEFTDVKMEEARTNPRIFVYDKRVWDVKPDSFCGDTFPLFVGDSIRRPKVLSVEEEAGMRDEDRHLLDWIPVEFAREFSEDITKALRDIAGHSTLATSPFLPHSEKVVANFGRARSAVRDPVTDFQTLPCVVMPGRIVQNDFPRYCHIDLALTGDSAGIVITHVPEFIMVGEEIAPKVVVDLVLEVRPPPNGEIQFNKIRSLLYKLRDLGMPIKWVSFDSFQSRDSVQILRQKGFSCGNLSIDLTMGPYLALKRALYDGRVHLPEHAKLQKELVALEVNMHKRKVDHNAHNSKDIADALAGAVYGISIQREVWGAHGITPSSEYVHKSKLSGDTVNYTDVEVEA
jgi:hypothetical protein